MHEKLIKLFEEWELYNVLEVNKSVPPRIITNEKVSIAKALQFCIEEMKKKGEEITPEEEDKSNEILEYMKSML